MQSMQYSPATQAINLAQLTVQYMKPVKVEMETVSSLVKGAMCFQLTRIQLGLSAPLHNVLWLSHREIVLYSLVAHVSCVEQICCTRAVHLTRLKNDL